MRACNGGMLLLIASVIVVSILAHDHEDSTFWYNEARAELEEALNIAPNYNTAKNIIVFIGDGMGISTVTAARIYKGQQNGQSGEEGHLFFEKFPHVGLSKTYNPDRQVADSAGTATAFWCGYKGNFGTLGTDVRVKRFQCPLSLNPQYSRPCIMEWAQNAGKHTGLVTTTRLTHATPGALYSKSADRNWECDSDLTKEAVNCKDIARQMIEDTPGNRAKVLFGGGRQMFMAGLNDTEYAPENPQNCVRGDGRDLVQEWLEDKKKQSIPAVFVSNTDQLRAIDIDNTDSVLGLFSNSHLSYDDERDKSGKGEPTLAEMVGTAISILSKNPQGFFLAVEAGRIDHAHHDTTPRRSLAETVALEEAVRVAREMTSVRDTTIVVTADHSHTLTIQGYPERGQDILGTPENSNIDGLPFPTLSYSNGKNFNYTWNGTHAVRRSLVGVDTADFGFVTPVGTPYDYETHGGEDVAIFASGPWAHLFHGVHEQSYIPHVLAHAAKIGPRADCSRLSSPTACRTTAASSKLQQMSLLLLLSVPLTVLMPLIGV